MDDKNTVIQNLKDNVSEFNHERDWKRYHCPKNLSMQIAIEAAELMEHFQWISTQDSWDVEPDKLEEVKDEIADILICTLNLCNNLKIDVSEAISEKLKQNAKKYPVKLAKGKALKYTAYIDKEVLKPQKNRSINKKI